MYRTYIPIGSMVTTLLSSRSRLALLRARKQVDAITLSLWSSSVTLNDRVEAVLFNLVGVNPALDGSLKSSTVPSTTQVMVCWMYLTESARGSGCVQRRVTLLPKHCSPDGIVRTTSF